MKLISLLTLAIIAGRAQAPVPILRVSSAPSGSCISTQALQLVTPIGELYSCQSGTWVIINSSGGTVTSVTGTSPIASSGGSTPAISLSGVTSEQGNGAKVQLSTGTTTNGNCVSFDSNGNTVDSLNPCGGAGLFLSGTTDPGVPIIPSSVQTASGNSHTGLGTSMTVATSSNVTSGNTMVVFASCQNANITTATDTRSTSYSLVLNSSLVTAFVGTLTSSGADTVTINGSGACANMAEIVEEVENSTGVVDGTTQTSTSSTGPPSITTTVPEDLILLGTTILNCGSSITFTATSPSAIDVSFSTGNSMPSMLGHLSTTTAGTYTPNISNNGGSCGNGQKSITFAIKPIPVVSPGVNGDFYLNLTTGYLWGPKTSGIWSSSGWKLSPI